MKVAILCLLFSNSNRIKCNLLLKVHIRPHLPHVRPFIWLLKYKGSYCTNKAISI